MAGFPGRGRKKAGRSAWETLLPAGGAGYAVLEGGRATAGGAPVVLERRRAEWPPYWPAGMNAQGSYSPRGLLAGAITGLAMVFGVSGISRPVQISNARAPW